MDPKVPIPSGAYNPGDYANLNVAQEVKELFKYIDRYLNYKPQSKGIRHLQWSWRPN